MKTPTRKPADTFKVGDTEVFMSYARLLRVVSLFPQGLPELTSASSDTAVHASIVEILLADKGIDPEDYPTFESYELTMEQGEGLVEWGLAHAFGFFARKVNATLEQAKATALTIKEVETAAKEATDAMSS